MVIQSRVVIFLVLLFCTALSCRTADPLVDVHRTPSLWKVLGTSVEDQPIYHHSHGNGDDVILVIGCTHGDEQVTGQIVVRLAEFIAGQQADAFRRTLIFIPFLNPDGVAHGTRTNARGVDINRNFPTKNWRPVGPSDKYFPGPAPLSEPETQLLVDLFTRTKPRLVISIHSSLHMINYDGPAKEIAERMARFNGYRVSDSIGYPTPGSFGTYVGVERNIPIITLELPPVQVDEAWQQNREALLEVLLR